MTAQLSKRIVVGVDGTAASTAALQWAADEAVTRNLSLDVIHVWDPPLPFLPDGYMAAIDPVPFQDAAWRILDEAVESLGDRRVGLDVRAVRREGHAAEVLVEYSGDAVMLVVGGSHHRLPAVHLGSAAKQCAHHASCPIVVVPPHWSPGPGPARVVVGVDGSSASAVALQWAVDEATAREAVLDVVHGWHVQPMADPSGYAYTYAGDELAKESQTLLEAMARALPSSGPRPLRLELRSVQAGPANALCELAQGAQLLVVGSRGRGGFARLLLGSVSEQCLHRVSAPIVLIRHGARSDG